MATIKVELTWVLDGQAHSHTVETKLKPNEGPTEGLRRLTKEAVKDVEAKAINW